MNRKLRAFVSSTMKDLANEREAVCGRLHTFNFEPVVQPAVLRRRFPQIDAGFRDENLRQPATTSVNLRPSVPP